MVKIKQVCSQALVIAGREVNKMGAYVHLFLSFLAVISNYNAQAFDIPDRRYLKAYISDDPDGPYHEFLDYSPDLRDQGLDNSIKRVCLTGFWLLYSDYNYSEESSERLGPVHVNGCEALPPSLSTSSLRYAGSPYHLDDSYYNLYEGIKYRGQEFRGNTNADSLLEFDLRMSSVIICGQSPWTFFTGLQFTGEAVCLYPTHINTGNNISLHWNFAQNMSQLGLPDNSIRSVAKGCLTDNVYRGDRPHQGGLGDAVV
ncbi:uncharacterized protein LOC108678686 isoform X2 [Hyalella azteca]|uniref:Uncharacterized protein LOC108678686 isoform X2 n=1 Tax=Hyalella azteca TaxID=294128 RepID=A0A8B7PBN5_HYAAZ|nr:uncharacterized protein LOC108678686 isoform X2 [Hyalella azteca]